MPANVTARLKPLLPAIVWGAALLAILVAVLASALRVEKPPAPPARARPAAVIGKSAPPKKVMVAGPVRQARPPGPSAFALENAMTYGQRMERWTPLIREASRRFNVSGQWIRAVIMIESGGRTMLGENRPITSPAGAMGLMQLMPETWREMRRAYRLGADPYDPHDNITAGTAVLAILYRQYGYPTMFAAYNDGPGMLAAHAALNQPLPTETENYVRNIASILSTGVMHRAGGPRSLARLTRPDGSAVMIDAASVVSIRDALPGEYAPGVQSVLAIGRLRQGVRESRAAAAAVIRAHGGLI
jgi:soluble lytic murein transglycosylase-like protein